MSLLRAIRPALSQYRRGFSEVAEVGWKTRSREEFARAFPKTAAKQDYHLKMLAEAKLPVHRSGKFDDILNKGLYAILTGMTLNTIVWFLMFKK
uniref:Uncharacterized protein n=1 Tax=Ciona intestinalis TaxID=7719 RepID=H2Y316_CIOIN